MTPHSIQQLERTFGFRFWQDDFEGWTCVLSTYTLLNVYPEAGRATIQTDSRKGIAPKWVHTVTATESQTLEDSVRLVLQEHIQQLAIDLATIKDVASATSSTPNVRIR